MPNPLSLQYALNCIPGNNGSSDQEKYSVIRLSNADLLEYSVDKAKLSLLFTLVRKMATLVSLAASLRAEGKGEI